MPTTFRPCEPDQMLLLAPNMRDWLPEVLRGGVGVEGCGVHGVPRGTSSGPERLRGRRRGLPAREPLEQPFEPLLNRLQ